LLGMISAHLFSCALCRGRANGSTHSNAKLRARRRGTPVEVAGGEFLGFFLWNPWELKMGAFMRGGTDNFVN
jgi:hypothetical protein